ncbi:MAG: DMT family transporter, partial [Alistipes sp.]|nr:DMT family transporter [Candidatus Minthomonas equi]
MSKKNYSKIIAHLSCLGAYLIFGFNIIVCKGLSNSGLMSAQLLFCFRAIGATLMFWTLSLFLPREKVAGKDLLRIFLASMIGLYMTQMFFLEGIRHITPMDCTMLTTLSPIFTMFIAAIAIKEPITLKKAGGVALSFCGVLFLIYNSVHDAGNVRQTEPIGIVLILLNGLFWAAYLGIFRSLINKYSV